MQEYNNKKCLKFIVSSIVAFLLAVLLTVATYLIGIYTGCLTESSFIKSIDRKEYIDCVIETLNEDAEAWTMPTGFDTSIVENLFQYDEVRTEVLNYVRATLRDQKYEISITAVKDRLNQNIDTFIASKGVSRSEIDKLDEYVKGITDIYVDDVTVPVIKRVPEYRNKIIKAIMIVVPCCLVLAIACIFMVIRFYTWKHRGIRFIAYSTIATAIMTMSVPIYAIISGFYKRVGLKPEYFYRFIVNIAHRLFVVCLLAGSVWILVTLILLCIIHYCKHHSVRTKRHSY